MKTDHPQSSHRRRFPRFSPAGAFASPILAVLTLFFGLVAGLEGHAVPDIPVRGSFSSGGDCAISVEVNPRCFDADPNMAASLTYAVYQAMTPERKEELRRMAAEFVPKHVEFFFEPLGQVKPEFDFQFSGEGLKPLEGPEDVVVLTGFWKTAVASGLTGWKIRATPATKLAVVFQNMINGAVHPRLAVLFPGETSFTLDLSELSGRVPAGPAKGSVSAQGSWRDSAGTFWNFFQQGFVHVLPEGLDHILFVLGIFLLSRAFRPLLLQVTAFTVAHSVTLALATLGLVKAPSSVVEPIIAASIAALAVENILHKRYSHWRLLVVFAFGLIHGLGFASALKDLDLPQSSLAVGLVGFNFGVEGGQLAVISLAAACTFWIRDQELYRRWVVLPASGLIAAVGLFWTVERILQKSP